MSEEEQIILPDGFTRAVYLESTGTQYIDTEYIPTANSGLWIDAQQITHSNGHPMGSGWDGNNPADGFTAPRWLKSTGNSCGFGWKTWVVWGYNGNGKRFKSTLNYFNSKKAEMIIDGETVNSSALGELGFTPSKSIYLFSTNYANSSTLNWNGIIYRAKISEGTEIVRDFIPCTDVDGVPCMYDLITQTAYYNEGSGIFLYANYVEEKEENTHVDLPNGYTKLDYLYSEGKQYIDTGYVPTNETGLYIDCQSYWSKYSFPMGVMESSSTGRLYSHRTSSTSGENKVGWNDNVIIWTTNLKLTHERYESRVNFYNGKFSKIDINDLSFESTLSGQLPTMSKSIYLFTINVGGSLPNSVWNTVENGHCGKIFRAKISQGDTVVRDYVPALDPDGVPCMFEVFTGEAYYNQGSGKFLTPLDFQRTKVPKNFKRVPWLESSGTQYINTGYIPNNETGLWIKCRKNNPTTATGLQIPFGMSGGTYIYPLSINNTYLQYSWGGYASTNGSYYYVDDGEPYESSLNFFNSKIVSFTSLENNYSKTDTRTLAAITRPLYLFTYNDNGTARYSLVGKVYRAKISQLDEVVRDYVPCVDEAGIPCMYDLITQSAYYNIGTKSFTGLFDTNASYTDYCTLGIISDRLGVGDMDENVIGTLPSEFEKIDYVSFDKTQYIDTEMVCDDIGEMEIKIETGNEISTSSTTTWGGTTKGTSSSGSSYIYFNYSGDWGWMVSSYPELMSIISNKNWQSLKPNTLYDVKYTESSDMKTRDITVNGETKTLTIVSGYANTRSTINYYLGCRNKDGAKDVGGIYPFKLYNWSYKTRGGTLKAKMIPAKRKSDSQIGMYCLSRKTFYPVKPI